MVIYVVKNASRPVSGEDSPVPDGKRFSLLCGLYCNSGEGIMQVVSAGWRLKVCGAINGGINKEIAKMDSSRTYKRIAFSTQLLYAKNAV